ncbi:MAG: 3-deoxy-8-phosphooctulonate synthase, partial [Syntrophaceae bacterium]|nr:3-deoxy-8-phosphooctulonate synthase [Syntrophaceae bacterium]
MKKIKIGDFIAGENNKFILIAGPCVLENEKTAMDTARYLKKLTAKLKIPLIFKASYDKANRTSIKSYRGPGLKKGLAILEKIKGELNIPVLSDVHRFEEIDSAAKILDVVQVPAFLCRQTDFIIEIAKKARVINVKKGQFLAPWDVFNIIEKAKMA